MRRGAAFIWHMARTDHRLGFNGDTWAATCDCGRVFYPVGRPRCVVCGRPRTLFRYISTLSGRCAKCVARGLRLENR